MGILLLVSCTKNNKQGAADYPADNSGKNQTNGKPTTPSAQDQAGNDHDIGITKKIRQAVVADDSLSITAKNVKIITVNGMTTITGPVNSQLEKENIAQKAYQIAGATNVDNQLEVKTTN